jgi:hypothetical protein
LDLFADCNARVEIITLSRHFQRSLRQNRDRAAATSRSGHSPAGRCEPPTWLECHRLHMLSCPTT